MTDTPRPTVLVIAGLDPTGGAGVCADIESLHALGCRAAPVISALTVQDLADVERVEAVDAALIAAQIEAVRRSLPVAAVKLGMLATARQVEVIAAALDGFGHAPLVLDPVLRASGGGALAQESVAAALREHLVPRAALVTPNHAELALLSGSTQADQGAAVLLRHGADAVLVTGADQPGATVEHHLYRRDGTVAHYTVERLPGRYHGSGCTLASAVAAQLAHGVGLDAAITAALDFTLTALRRAFRPGRDQWLPLR